MENEIYWSERLANETQKSSDELLKVMKNLYKDSMKNIKKEIESFYGRYAENNNLTLQEVHKRLNPSELKSAKEEIKKYYDKVNELARDNNGKVSVEKLKKYKDELRLQSAKAYMSRLEEVKLNIKNSIVNLAIQEEIEFTDKLKNVYENSLSQSSYNIDKTLGFSEGFSAPNEDVLNKSIKTKWLGENYSDRIWKNKGNLIDSLDTILLQGIAQGQNPRKIAEEMAIKYGANYKNCERLARTEFIHAQNEATFQSYKNHNIQEYQYVADLSERTCPVCGSLDGQHFPLKYKQVGVNYPVMHPNCRCTTIPYFEKDEIDLMFEESTRIAYDEDRNIYEVPSSMTYEEWKKTISDNSISKNNEYEITFKKKTKDEIDKGWKYDWKNSNPHYVDSLFEENGYKKYEYTENCQRCAIVYEYRRRGYNVEALPKLKNDVLSYHFTDEIWKNKDGSNVKYKRVVARTRQKIMDNLTQELLEYDVGSRFELKCTWSVGGGHAFNAEIVEDYGRKKVKFIDAQTGSGIETSLLSNLNTIDGVQYLYLNNKKIKMSDLKDVMKECEK